MEHEHELGHWEHSRGPENGPEDKWTDFIHQYCNGFSSLITSFYAQNLLVCDRQSFLLFTRSFTYLSVHTRTNDISSSIYSSCHQGNLEQGTEFLLICDGSLGWHQPSLVTQGTITANLGIMFIWWKLILKLISTKTLSATVCLNTSTFKTSARISSVSLSRSGCTKAT